MGFLLYKIFFKKYNSETIISEEIININENQLPVAQEGSREKILDNPVENILQLNSLSQFNASEIAQGELTQTPAITNTSISSPVLSADGNHLQYYNPEDNKFYKINENGQATILTNKIFYNIENIIWSSKKNKAILEYPDGANIIYDFFTNKQTTLPKHWKDFDFNPDSNKIVMKSIGIDVDNRWLAVSNDDNSKTKIIESLGTKDATVYPSWSPNNQTVAMYTQSIGLNKQELFFVGLNKENFKSIIIEGRGFQSQWSPNGNKLLYSIYSSNNNLKPSLWVVNAKGDNIGSGKKNLGVDTWSNKCTFNSNENIFCAIPEKLENGSGVFPELAKNTSDNLYQINVLTGIKKLIAIPDGSYNIFNIIITKNKEYLYFTNGKTNKLHKVKLK